MNSRVRVKDSREFRCEKGDSIGQHHVQKIDIRYG
jgi:hypothetical protein